MLRNRSTSTGLKMTSVNVRRKSSGSGPASSYEVIRMSWTVGQLHQSQRARLVPSRLGIDRSVTTNFGQRKSQKASASVAERTEAHQCPASSTITRSRFKLGS
jgi:hypothetical protein